MIREASIKKRYFYKLATNLLGALLGFLTMLIVPRALGPVQYGYFEYITENFLVILTTLASSLPVAYFNWMSRKGHKTNIDTVTGLNIYFHFFVISVFGIFLGFSIYGDFHGYLWPKIPVWVLWMGLFFSSFTFLFQLLGYLADGKALTVELEKFRLIQNTFRAIGLIILFILGILSLQSYFLLQSILLAIIVIAFFLWIIKRKFISTSLLYFWDFNFCDVKNYFNFTYNYIKPLVLLTALGFVYLFFDRWFLQIIGGAGQQGFYSLAYRLGALSFIFTNAMTPVLGREFAYAFEESNSEKLRKLFNRIKIFLFIATVLGVFISVQSRNIIQIIGGASYAAAIVPVTIMSFYPIHQTFGQLSASLLLATGQTKLYSKIGIFTSLLGIPLTYFLVAPKTFIIPGLGLGSTGLALKMVIVQIIATNIQLYFNTKSLGFSFWHWIWIQIRLIVFILFLAGVASYLGNSVETFIGPSLKLSNYFFDHLNILSELSNILLSGIIYGVFVMILIFIFPAIAGTSKSELHHFMSSIQNKFRTSR